MAEAFTNKFCAERGLDIVALSAGTIAGAQINPVALAAMDEVGASMASQHPKQLTSDMIAQADRIVTMGCGVDAEACPAKFYVTEDWGLDDPKGASLDAVRTIRDQIRDRVLSLLIEISEE
jgi:protein-tyrosine-phosphatase